MAVELATAYVNLVPSAKGITGAIEKELKPLEQAATQTGDRAGAGFASAFSKHGAQLQSFGLKAFAAGGLAVAGLTKAANAAGDLSEAVAAAEVVFGEGAEAVIAFGKTAADSIGQSNRAAVDAATTFGTFGKAAGLTGKDLAGFSLDLVTLSSDLASFKNTTPEVAVEALGAALRGESEPIRQFGVLLDDATLKQRALDLGLIETTTGTLPPAIKVQAAYAEILAQTGDAQGDFARTSDGLANSQRTAAARFEDAKAAIGEGFLPILTAVTEKAGSLAQGFANLNESTGGLASQVLSFGAIGLGAAGALAYLVGKALTAVDTFQDLGSRFRDTEGGLTRLGKAGVASFGALGIAAAGFAVAQYAADQSAKRFSQSIEDLGTATDEQLITTIKMAAALGTLDFEKVADASLGGAIRIRDLALANEEFAAALTKAGLPAAELTRIIAAETESQARANEVTTAGTEAVDALSGSTTGLGDAAAGTTPEIEEMALVAASSIEVISAMEQEFDAAADQASAFNDAIDGLIGSQIGLDAASDDLLAGAQGLVEAFKENGLTLDANTEKGRANRDAIREQASSILDYGAKSLEAGSSVAEAADQVNYLTAGLRQQLLDLGLTEQAADDYISTLGLTPESVLTAIHLSNVEVVKAQVEDHLARLGDIDPLVATEIQALIDEGKWAEVQRRLRELENKKISIAIELRGGSGNFSIIPGTKSAMGNYFDRPGFTSIAEDYDPEAVLTLGKPANLAHQLADPRIGGPIFDALALNGSSGGSTGDFTLINNVRPLSPADVALAMRMRELMAPGSTVRQ